MQFIIATPTTAVIVTPPTIPFKGAGCTHELASVNSTKNFSFLDEITSFFNPLH
jgi:hypothetical protein